MAVSYSINVQQMIKELTITSPKSLEAFAKQNANQRLKEEKINLINEFEEHPVTEEIAAGAGEIQNKVGPSVGNTSNTLGGKGNLFGFIGFPKGTDPIKPVREELASINVSDDSKRTVKDLTISYEFSVKDSKGAPFSADSLNRVAPMPDWEKGRSWLVAIEKGISGFNRYLYWKANFPGRSGGGIEATQALRKQSYSPIQYITPLLAKFAARLRKKY